MIWHWTETAHRAAASRRFFVVAGAATLSFVSTGCSATSGASPSLTGAATVSSSSSVQSSPSPREAQLVSLAQHVYFSSGHDLTDCALKAGSFVGFAACPFTAGLVTSLSTPNGGDTLECASQAAQPAPTTYAATASGSGGTVQVSVPANPPIVYTLTVLSTGGLLRVDDISFTRQGTTTELTAQWCAGTAVPASP
jgi:hypothetical protein